MTVSPLEGASRSLPKVTHVPLVVEFDPLAPGNALGKFGYLSQLSLQPGDVDAVRGPMRYEPGHGGPDLSALLGRFEGAPIPSALPAPSAFVHFERAELLGFGRQLQIYRGDQLQSLIADGSDAKAIAEAQLLLHAAVVANNGFDSSGAVSPVGMLNLERLEMTPAGMQRGELVATIPLAPGETTTVFQREWSVTSQEFSSIVTDSLDNYSETGVTENTELAQSRRRRSRISNQFNVNATASGGVGFVSGSTSASFGSQDQHSQSATDSRKDAVTTTRSVQPASSRNTRPLFPSTR